MQDRIVHSCSFPWTSRFVTTLVFQDHDGRRRTAVAGHKRHGISAHRAIRGTYWRVRSCRSSLYRDWSLRRKTLPDRARQEHDSDRSSGDGAAGPICSQGHLIVYAESAGLRCPRGVLAKNGRLQDAQRDTLGGNARRGQRASSWTRPSCSYPTGGSAGPRSSRCSRRATKSGWVFALHFGPNGPDLRLTFVAARGCQQRAQAAFEPANGMDDGDRSEVQDRTEGSPDHGGLLPHVATRPRCRQSSWVWWPEKNDLVIGGPLPVGR